MKGIGAVDQELRRRIPVGHGTGQRAIEHPEGLFGQAQFSQDEPEVRKARRHVWMFRADALHLQRDGLFLKSPCLREVMLLDRDRTFRLGDPSANLGVTGAEPVENRVSQASPSTAIRVPAQSISNDECKVGRSDCRRFVVTAGFGDGDGL